MQFNIYVRVLELNFLNFKCFLCRFVICTAMKYQISRHNTLHKMRHDARQDLSFDYCRN